MNTLKELAGTCGVPATTLRLLREEFHDLIPVVGEGRRRRYTEEGASVLKQIVGWRQGGWSSARIREELLRERTPQQASARRASDSQVHEIAAQLRAQGAEIALLRVEVGALRQEIARLTDVLRASSPPSVQSVLEE